MKTKLIIFLAICALVADFKVLGFAQPLDASNSNYVVIGAFAVEDHARIWVENAKKINFTAVSAINPARNLYYVYVLHTGDRKAAFSEAKKIRGGTPYWDTWVYTGLLGNEVAGTATRGSDLNPITGQTIDKVAIQDAAVLTKPDGSGTVAASMVSGTGAASSSGATGISTAASSSAASTSTPGDQVKTASAEEVQTTPVEETKTAPVEEAEEGSKNFLFRIVTAQDQKELGGDVDVMDVDKGKKVASYQGNQNVVLRPFNKSGNISLVCEVFGYRKVIRDLNFNRPQETDGVITEGSQTIVPFSLSRLQKGDFGIMYNVYFFKDAGIMRPESRSEVTSLVTMMKENPKYKIRIHGHTNGNAAGKVISMGESKKFFALTDTKEGFGSAKKLSEERAKVIREYLINEGIDQNRMEIKAWGGKRPVEDKMSAQAQSNVRVEIEILEDK